MSQQPPAVGRAVACSNRRRCSSGPSLSAKAAVERQWPGTAIGSQSRSSKSGSAIGAAQVVVGGRRQPRAPEVQPTDGAG